MDEGGSVDEAYLSRKRLPGEPEGSSFTWDPGTYVKKVSGCGYLSPWGPLSSQGKPGTWGARMPGTLMDE
jgi:hypothetical protein